MDHSPLTRLPAELREIIYALVLGGNDIHVSIHRTGGKPAFSTCTENTSHHDIITSLKQRNDGDFNFPQQLDHYNCATHAAGPALPRPVRLNTSLLLTCREVYEEAVLVPWKANTFIFSSFPDVLAFAAALPARKASAVAGLCLVSSSMSVPPGGFVLDRECMRLKCLRRLMVGLGVPTRHSYDGVTLYLEGLERAFGGLPFAEVDIVVRLRRQRRSVEECRRLCDEFGKVAEETKRRLLDRSD